MKITEYPYLKLTQAEFDAVVAADTVINIYKDKIAEQESKFEQFAARDAEIRKNIELLVNDEIELKAKLKVLDSAKRSLRGDLAANIHRERRSRHIITQTEARILLRERQILLNEGNKDLNVLRKTLKLPRGKRAAQGATHIEIVDIKN